MFFKKVNLNKIGQTYKRSDPKYINNSIKRP